MVQIIQERLHCSSTRAEAIEHELSSLSPELQPLLAAWLKSGECADDTMYCGYSVHSLMKKYDMKFTGALLSVDWIIKDPESALKALSELVK